MMKEQMQGYPSVFLRQAVSWCTSWLDFFGKKVAPFLGSWVSFLKASGAAASTKTCEMTWLDVTDSLQHLLLGLVFVVVFPSPWACPISVHICPCYQRWLMLALFLCLADSLDSVHAMVLPCENGSVAAPCRGRNAHPRSSLWQFVCGKPATSSLGGISGDTIIVLSIQSSGEPIWNFLVKPLPVAPEARSTFLARPHPTICTPGRAGAAPKRWRTTTKIPRCCCTRRAIASQCCSLMRRRSISTCAKRSSVMAWRNLEILVRRKFGGCKVDANHGSTRSALAPRSCDIRWFRGSHGGTSPDFRVSKGVQKARNCWLFLEDRPTAVETVADQRRCWMFSWQMDNRSWSWCWCLNIPQAQPAVAETNRIQALGNMDGRGWPLVSQCGGWNFENGSCSTMCLWTWVANKNGIWVNLSDRWLAIEKIGYRRCKCMQMPQWHIYVSLFASHDMLLANDSCTSDSQAEVDIDDTRWYEWMCIWHIFVYIYIHTVYNTYVVIDIGGAKEAGMID